MNEEKGKTGLVPLIKDALEVLPDLLHREWMWGLLTSILHQWGPETVLPVLLGTVRNTIEREGLIGTVTSLLNLNLLRILPNLIIAQWDTWPDRDAFCLFSENKEEKVNCGQFKKQVFKFANGLANSGAKGGDRVIILAYNSIEYMEAMFGSLFGNCNFVLVNWHERGEKLFNIIDVRKPRFIVVGEEFLDDKIIPIKERLKSVEKYIVISEKAPEGMISFKDFLANSSDERPKTPFRFGLTAYSGGTTGPPKGIPGEEIFTHLTTRLLKELPHGAKSYKDVIAHLPYMLCIMHYFGGSKMKIRTLCVGPEYHAVPFYTTVMPFLFHGIPSVFTPKYDPELTLKAIDKEKCTHILAVPTHIYRMALVPDEVFGKYDLSSLRLATVCGAPCGPNVKMKLNEKFRKFGYNDVACEYYGSSESANHQTILLPEHYQKNPKKIESCGWIMGPSYYNVWKEEQKKGYDTGHVCIADKEGHILPPNKEGLLHIRTIGTMTHPGYIPGTTPEKIENILDILEDGKEWLNELVTGYIDEDNFLYPTGRVKEMIMPGGVNIPVDDIEDTIFSNPKVYDVAVVPYPDKDLGEVVCSAVQLKGGESATEDEIINYCKEKGLYGYKVPRKVDFWKELPRIDDGKMVKPIIVKKYWEDRGIKRRG